MRDRQRRIRQVRHGAFNTPLEMHKDYAYYFLRAAHATFNTPLEMLSWALRRDGAYNSLSILHWRCASRRDDDVATTAAVAFQYSIGDTARRDCGAGEAVQVQTFNTPLEMLAEVLSEYGFETQTFNTPLEMR